MNLGAAIDVMRTVVTKAHRDAMSRSTLAHHLGYMSLNGRVLTKIAALRSFGLIAGQSHDMRVSNDAITILEAPKVSLERQKALSRCAFHSALFTSIVESFPEQHPGERDLERWLTNRGFRAQAAAMAAAVYLATMKTLADGNGAYQLLSGRDDASPVADEARERAKYQNSHYHRSFLARREVISLSEGDVTITYPENVSVESCEDLAASFELFLTRARRRAAAQQKQN